jgi:hypothetical protein
MCMELMYENSPSKGLVDIAYLAVDDKMLVNKTIENEWGGADNFSFFDNEIWLRVHTDSDKILTALITYNDTDEWETSLQKVIVDLGNNDFHIEAIDNVLDMFLDGLGVNGLIGTQTSDLVFEVLQILLLLTIDQLIFVCIILP